MSEELLNGCGSSDCCSGDCSSCGGFDSEEHRTITLTMEDDTEVECAVLTIYPVNNKQYIALLPLDENGQSEDGEVYLYGFTQTPDGDPMLANIEDDEEYAAAADAFDSILENAKTVAAADAPQE